MKLTHIYVDMDGVLCDFAGAAFAIHGHNYDHDTYPKNEMDIEKVLGLTHAEFWGPIDAVGPEYWANLAPLPWAFDLIKLCQGLARALDAKLRIATKPHDHWGCGAGKMLWLRRHTPDLRYILIKDKEELAAPGRVLVDDSSHNIQSFKVAGGETVLIPHPWNGTSTPPDMLEHVRLGFSSLLGKEVLRDGTFA